MLAPDVSVSLLTYYRGLALKEKDFINNDGA